MVGDRIELRSSHSQRGAAIAWIWAQVLTVASPVLLTTELSRYPIYVSHYSMYRVTELAPWLTVYSTLFPVQGHGVFSTLFPVQGHGVISTLFPVQGRGVISTLFPVQGHGVISTLFPVQSHGVISTLFPVHGHGVISTLFPVQGHGVISLVNWKTLLELKSGLRSHALPATAIDFWTHDSLAASKSCILTTKPRLFPSVDLSKDQYISYYIPTVWCICDLLVLDYNKWEGDLHQTNS